MKLRYFIPTLVAVLAMLVGCSEDNDPTYLGNIKVSQSYIGLPAAGGSVTVTVNAQGQDYANSTAAGDLPTAQFEIDPVDISDASVEIVDSSQQAVLYGTKTSDDVITKQYTGTPIELIETATGWTRDQIEKIRNE